MMARSAAPSPEDLATLQDRFDELQASVDVFSSTLERLASARRGPNRNSVQSRELPPSAGRVHGVGSTGVMCAGHIRCDGLSSVTRGDSMAGVPVTILVLAGAFIVAVIVQSLRQRKESRRGNRSSPPGRTAKYDPCDIAFLAHPSSILSTFALWMPEIRPQHRWNDSWWMVPAWPVVFIVSLWNLYVSPLICGPYFVVDTFRYCGMENQVWLSRAFGYQFMMKCFRRRIARGIEEAVREADRTGVSVMGLGALNKAEFINRGGEDILEAFQPAKTRLVHGNTLTAAVVVENAKTVVLDGGHARSGRRGGTQATGEERCVFLTGATSKVGRAVALKLALKGFDVVCCTGSDDRFEALQMELDQLDHLKRSRGPQVPGNSDAVVDDASARLTSRFAQIQDGSVDIGARLEQGHEATGRLLRARRVDEGVRHRVWIIGKSDPSVRQHLPLNASAVVFAVPCPLEGYRPDVTVASGGILRLEETACTPRQFHVLLPHDEVYACHAAAVVHRSMGWTHHEIGKVDVTRMDVTLRASRVCGFTIPHSPKRTQPSRDATGITDPRVSSAVWPPLPVWGDSGNLSFSTSTENQQASGVTDAVSQPAPSSFPEFCRVVVVGAGASGLSAAACLKRRGEHDVLLLERSSSVGGSWAAQYEGLKITTRHKHCGLPGWPVPKEGFCERGDGELSAPDFLRYLTGYCRRFDLDVATDTEVLSAEQEHADGEGAFNRVHGGIRLQIRRASVPGGAATISVVRCTHIVVATGKNASPAVPSDILRTLGTFSGEVVHSSKVSGISALARRKVCIVGMGNSACDLALALLEYGAGKVYISTRSAPPIIMRQWGPLSLEWVSRSIQYLPSKFVDSVLVAFGMARWGKNWRHRAFPKGLRQTWQARSSGRVPCIDKGELVPALLDRRIEVHGCIECAHGSFLHFRNSGAVKAFDVVILATGFEVTHKRWLNHDLLRGGAKRGVHLVGFNNGRALLPLRQIGKEAEELAARICP